MEKYVINIQDLVILALKNDSKFKSKVKSGDPTSCYKMGMIYLLGINTPVDFKKSSYYFSNQSLANDSNANRLLGFIAECEGDFSLALKKYVDAAEKDTQLSYIEKAIKQRDNLKKYFKKCNLPIALNNEISLILDDIKKGGETTVDAYVRIAMICNDKETCMEAAHNLYKAEDFITAKRWLKKGHIDSKDPLFVSIDHKLLEAPQIFNFSGSLQVIDIVNKSLLDNNSLPSVDKMRELCSRAASLGKQMWKEQTKILLEPIINEEKEKLDDLLAVELAEKEAEIMRKKKLKDKSDTYCGFICLIILAASGYYLYSNYSFLTSTVVLVVIFFICGLLMTVIEKILGIDSIED
ncbi:MAG: sel1 repeat family protein [Prevotella sp.]|nr:sel1 repeat family protein [Prevotella sp.]